MKELAQQTLELIDQGTYTTETGPVQFSTAQQEAVLNTRLYTPSEMSQLRDSEGGGTVPDVEVVDATTQVAAQRMARQYESSGEPIALLNFASARNPGGGFLNGAKAQEEDLCRCSGLYPCLLTRMEYYEANRQQDSLIYTDHLIFSPQVPFFKIRGTGDLLAEPFQVSVITAPAPNTGPFLKRHPGEEAQLEAAFLRRWESVIAVCRDQSVSHLLLGAWGCGAFRGDPEMAARTAKLAIQRQAAGMKRIVFAIPGKGRQSKANLDAFRQVFS